MARVRTAAHPKPVEQEEETQEVPDETPAFELNQPSKAEMVRTAMADGLTKPGDIAAFIKSRYQTDIPKPQVSSYMSQQKARERKAGGGDSAQPRTHVSSQAGIPASFGDDVKLVKQLITQAGGAEELKDLANSLASLNQKYGQAGLDSLIDALE